MSHDLPAYLKEAASQYRLDQARLSSQVRWTKGALDANPPWIWGPQSFYLYDTAQLIQLYPPQIEGMKAALERDEDGNYKYSTVVWSWPKKSAKSTIISLVVDWVATNKPRAQIRLIANDLRQADSRVGFYLRESIKLGAALGYPNDPGERLREFRMATKISNSNYVIEYPNGSRVEMVPIDPAGEAGGNDDMLVFSELWGWKSQAHQRMWSEATISANRFGQAQRWIDTYAGFEGDSPVLENVYKRVVATENRVHPDYEFYAAGSIFATWITVPLLPWQTPEYYAQEQANLDPSEYARMHRNQWGQATNTFGPLEWWEACKSEHFPPIDQYTEIVIGVDAATDSDCFAMVAVSKHAQMGALPDPETGEIPAVYAIRYVGIWYPEQSEQWDFKEPKSELRRLCREYNVAQIAYDRYQLFDTMKGLEEEGIAWIEPFDQLTERDISDKMLYDTIRQKRIMHWGDPELTKHYQNADKKTDGRRMRIVKRAAKQKIDGLVALSMALKRAHDIVTDF